MDTDLRSMVMAFRVSELQAILGYANRNRNGRKNELQARALELAKSRDHEIVNKIRELYKNVQFNLTQTQSLLASSGASVQPPSMVHSSNHYGNNPNLLRGVVSSSMYNPSNAEKNRPSGSYGVTYGVSSTTTMSGLHQISRQQQQPQFPLCPDVRLKSLPFYEIKAELHKPSTLIGSSSSRLHEQNFTFCLTPSQASDIASSREHNSLLSNFGEMRSYTNQVQLRFCLLDSSAPQDDSFPPSINVKVNGKNITLPTPIPANRPGVEAKRPSRPLNITPSVKMSPTVTNTITVNWSTDLQGRSYVLSVYLVKKLCSQDLLTKLKVRGPRPAEFTKGMIKELVKKDDADCIAASSFKVSIQCPLGKCRMSLPVRASTCNHLQCFDGNLYLQMNEKKPVWACPVCDKHTLFEDLAIDGYFQEVVNDLTGNNECSDIEVLPDGSWRAIEIKKETEPPAKRVRQEKTTVVKEIICLDIDDDDDDVDVGASSSSNSSTTNANPKSQVKGEAKDPPLPPSASSSSGGGGGGASSSSNSKGGSKGVVVEVDLTLSSDEEETSSPPPKNNTIPSSSSTSGKIGGGGDSGGGGESSGSVKKSVVEEENTSSSEEELTQMVLRKKRPTYLIDDSSSSSSSSSSEEEPKKRITRKAPPAPSLSKPKRPPPTESPDCIILDDSPVPSPEPKKSTNPSSGSANSTTTTTNNTNSTTTTSGPSDSFGTNSASGSIPTGPSSSSSTHSKTSDPSSTSNTAKPSSRVQPTARARAPSPSLLGSFDPYGYWDATNNLTTTNTTPQFPDYTSLDFSALDYYNQEPANFNPNSIGGRGNFSSGSGNNGGRW